MAAPPKKAPKPKALPKTLGACADALYNLRQSRLALSREVDLMEKEEAVLRDHIIDTLPKSQAGGISGKIGCVTLGKKTVPRVTDWDKFYAHILKTKDFSMLQRRTGDAAIGERWDAGKEVPGVERFNVVTLSVTKA